MSSAAILFGALRVELVFANSVDTDEAAHGEPLHLVLDSNYDTA